MIYLIYGENTYLSKKKRQELIQNYRNLGFRQEIFDANDLDFTQLIEKTRSQSLFGEKKFFLINGLSNNKTLKEKFLKEIERFQDQEIIIFEEKNLSQKDKIVKLIKNVGGEVFYYAPLKAQEIKKLISQELKNEGFSIEKIALETLIEFLGCDLSLIEKEIEKLKTYKFFEKRIDTQDVLKMIRPKIDLDIFKMVEAIAQRHKKTALNLINKHLQNGDSPLYLFSMINFQFRNLIVFQEGKSLPQFFEESGLSPFQIQRLRHQSHLFSLEKLKKIYHKLFKIDLAIKTGKLEPAEGLELLILET